MTRIRPDEEFIPDQCNPTCCGDCPTDECVDVDCTTPDQCTFECCGSVCSMLCTGVDCSNPATCTELEQQRRSYRPPQPGILFNPGCLELPSPPDEFAVGAPLAPTAPIMPQQSMLNPQTLIHMFKGADGNTTIIPLNTGPSLYQLPAFPIRGSKAEYIRK